MHWLYAYLGTTIFNYIICGLVARSTANRIVREGYTYTNKGNNKSLSERILGRLKTIFSMSIPGLNFLNALYLLCRDDDKLYEEQIERLLLEGYIVKENNKEKNVNGTVTQEINSKTYSQQKKEVVIKSIDEQIRELQQLKEEVINDTIEKKVSTMPPTKRL